MKLYNTAKGLVLEKDVGTYVLPELTIDILFKSEDPIGLVGQLLPNATSITLDENTLKIPLQSQEIWAAGVTYFRSRSARIEESKGAGGGDFYDRVYQADRPEIFFKATPHRAVGPGEPVVTRTDSTWDVPEPELTLAITKSGKIFGYTVGNDMSSRSIEGDNPLYLPQAKTYRGCAAIGPCILIQNTEPAKETRIKLIIKRDGDVAFSGQTDLGQITRSFGSLRDYLFRDNLFPYGVFLMTGTGIIPEDSFTLKSGDAISIEIDGIGTLQNTVE